jgi:hypothetical protein
MDQQGRRVTFWPFLVFTQRDGRERAVWLPYWHTIEDGGTRISRYGQWAPFMDGHLFTNLLDQARAAGYLEAQGPGEFPASAKTKSAG